MTTDAELQAENAKLKAALSLAVTIIENYQAEICSEDNAKWLGVDLKQKGFCQGRSYLNSVHLVELEAGCAISAKSKAAA